jgi:predicted component of type VI protein secretion system
VLTQIAGADQPKAQATMDRHLFHLYGLNTQETAILRGASLELRALLQQLSPAARSVRPDPSRKLTVANQAALAALAAQRDQKVEVLANRILNQVRPQVAALFRLHGRILSNPANRPSARR